jgi:hypothetical protein
MDAVDFVSEYAARFSNNTNDPQVFFRNGNGEIDSRLIENGLREFGFFSTGRPKVDDAVVVQRTEGLYAYAITQVWQDFGGDNPYWKGQMKCVNTHGMSINPETMNVLRNWLQNH